MNLEKKKYKIRYFFNLISENFFKKKLDFNWNQYSNRFEIINKIINYKNYKKYLEIGCFKDENFDKININYKVGVDPVSGGTIRDTSDNYFIKNKDNFDIIFIDGLHHYEQVKKDILNSLNFLNDGGIILVHDCLPSRARDQMIPRSHENWNGDVWKAIVEFRTKKDLDTYVCMADQGLGLIIKRENRNNLDLKIINFKGLKFKNFYYNYETYMNVINEEKLFKII